MKRLVPLANRKRLWSAILAILLLALSLPAAAHEGHTHFPYPYPIEFEDQIGPPIDPLTQMENRRAPSAPTQAHLEGQWSQVYDWPVIAIHAALQPTGKVLAWDYAFDDFGDEQITATGTHTRVSLWDPQTNQHQNVSNLLDHNMFCTGSTHLPDGTLFAAGGGQGRTLTSSSFSDATETWSSNNTMSFARWYPTATSLADGDVLVTSGGPAIPEVYDPDTDTWRQLSSANLNLPLFPWLQPAPNGTVFYAGPNATLRSLNTNGSGGWTTLGTRDGVNRTYGVHAMYDIGKILIAGGGGSVRSSVIVDANTGDVTNTGAMVFGRRQHNATVLPDGSVIVTGGNFNGTSLISKAGQVYEAELWDPATGSWTALAPMQRYRQYHSTALLLPDATVLSAGGGVCGDCTNANYSEPNAEIFFPPYLFNEDGSLATRPEITSSPESVNYNATVQIGSNSAASIDQVSLIKLSSVTHSVNQEQRRIPLDFNQVGSNLLNVVMPSSPNIAPPGYYMLFIIDDAGVPSVAEMVRIEAGDTPPPVDQLVAEWRMDEEAWTGSAVEVEDEVGIHHGQATNGASTTEANPAIAGDEGTCGSGVFNGVNQKVQVPYSAELNPTNFTMAFWARVDGGSGTWRSPVTTRWQNSDTSVRRGFNVYAGTNNRWQFWTGTGVNSWDVLTGPTVVNGEWVHVAISFEASAEQNGRLSGTKKLYINGVPAEKAAWYQPNGLSPFNIGAGGVNGTTYFYNGALDEMRVYNYVLTDSAVADLMSDTHACVENVPPVAAFTATPTGAPNGILFDATTASDVDGTIVSYDWVTGDGAIASGQILDYTYPEPGTYLVSLTVTDDDGATHQIEQTIVVEAFNTPPVLVTPADQTNVTGDPVNFSASATDADGNALTFSATNLPTGVTLNAQTGAFGGSPSAAGVRTVTLSVSDGQGGSDSATFTWTVVEADDVVINAIEALPEQVGTAVGYSADVTGGNTLQYRWNFGDGTATTAYSSSPDVSHTFAQAGRYFVTLTVRNFDGGEHIYQFTQAIVNAPTGTAPQTSSSILVHSGHIWNVNPDNATVTVINAATQLKVAEIGVGLEPVALGLSPNGRIWVVNQQSATITELDASTMTALGTISLPLASAPYGIVFDASFAYVALEATGELARLNATTGALNTLTLVGTDARHLAIDANGIVYVSRFVTPPVAGEDTATPNVAGAGGEVVIVDNMVVQNTILLAHGNQPDTQNSARGLPNYVGGMTIAPDGLTAWVPSKQDNILRGTLRDGQNLTHDSTVRAISSFVDMTAGAEQLANRVDHDNASLASAASFGRYGSYLFVALETSREVAVLDAYARTEIGRVTVGIAPQGVAVSADGLTLYVHNFMSRSVSIVDISDLVRGQSSVVALDTTVDTVSNESLSAEVLLGKQLFYDAADDRLAHENYMSCASCHNGGGQDGRVWDLTGFGEGLRNTITLEGHGDHGVLHWTGNFDEVQDFEGQIRDLAGGSGLLTDAQFNSGTVSDPLGSPKTGLNADLDALAAYVESLSEDGNSPYRGADGTLTSAGLAGRVVFEAGDCAACHSGVNFTDSALDVRHNIGTLDAASGDRLGSTLNGLDTPTLRGLWNTAPYLHDGSAATLADAVNAHNGVGLSSAEVASLVTYLLQIDDREPAPNSAPVLAAIADQTDTINQLAERIITATDVDNDPLTFSASGLPNGLQMAADGTISGTPIQVGSFSVTVSVSDGRNGSDSAQFNWTIEDDGPTFTCTPGLLMERWIGIPGTSISDLTSHSSYLSDPASAEIIASFQTSSFGDDYGMRVRGYIVAPATGSYTFWIASDDNGELWLSSDDSATNVALIASVPGWTNVEEYDKYPQQMSAPITLVAGERYYVEGFMKEFWGGDHIAVAWQMDGGVRSVITSADTCALQQIGSAPTAAATSNVTSGTAPLAVSFDASGSADADGNIVSYDWTFGDGSTASGATVSHTYLNPGIYTAQVIVTDNDGRTDSAAVTITADSGNLACGQTGVMFDLYNNISGGSIADLLNAANYPHAPDSSERIDLFEIPVNAADSYGVRLRALLTAPVSGDYIFWIASDDNGSLRLSPSDNPDAAVEIANVPSWTPSQQWDWFDEQQSAAVTLTAGETYYLEALMKEAGGGDNLAVAWQPPGGTRQLIPSQVLCPAEDNGAPPSAAIAATPLVGDAPLLVTFDGSGSSDPDGPIASYAWTFGDGNGGNGTTTSHTYNTPGSYQATLTVTDADGRFAEASVLIHVTSPGGEFTCGGNGVRRELYNNIWGGSVSDLLNDPRFPNSPDSVTQLSTMQVPSNVGDGYGSRMRGYIVAPETGLYTFWVASDNEGQLWLSSDLNPANATQIAQTWWSPEQGWDFSNSQRSAEIPLVAGQAYYIEGLHQAAWGSDYYAVAWQTPSGPRELIPNAALCVYESVTREAEMTRTSQAEQALNTDISLTASNIMQTVPLSVYPEVMTMVVANQPLRAEAFALQEQFVALLLEDGTISSAFVADFVQLWDAIYAEASAELRAWMDAQSIHGDPADQIGRPARTVWNDINATSQVPTSVMLETGSAAEQPMDANVVLVALVMLLAATRFAVVYLKR